MSAPVCHRGEIWLVNFNPGRGSEQTGIRPAFIVQNNVGNQYAATTIVAAITTTLKKYPVTVFLTPPEGRLKETSMVNLAQMLTIEKTRLIKRFGSVSVEKQREIDTAIRVSLGLEEKRE